MNKNNIDNILIFIIFSLIILIFFKLYNNENFSSNTLENKLITLETKYGGLVNGACPGGSGDPNRKCQGGDKFGTHHNYQNVYAKELEPYLNKKNNILEIGVFKGNSLVIWSDLFPKSNIIGFDIQLEAYNNNKQNLINKGGFKNNNVTLLKCNTTSKNQNEINKIKTFLNNKKLDIIIDDGCHSNNCIINTFKNIFPYLNKNGVYIIEDNKSVYTYFRKNYKHLNIQNIGELTIIKY